MSMNSEGLNLVSHSLLCGLFAHDKSTRVQINPLTLIMNTLINKTVHLSRIGYFKHSLRISFT
jgi:hypothetical protein